MTAFKKTLLISIFICFGHLAFSQIKITSPQNRAVYQRNGFGYSAVTVAGSYDKQIDKVEARLTPVAFGQGEATNWETIKVLPLNGNFSVERTVRQGWYKLEVRGSLNGVQIGDVATVDRVGVGEVFIIAGQSNAEGVEYIQGVGASDDRVNCYSRRNDLRFGGTDNIALSDFSKLDANTNIAPRGPNGWCWGKLGDLLANRLNVPIMFFNVAFGGTTSDMWARTARGETAYNPYAGEIYFNNLPYRNLSDVLHYYTTQLGVRAVLWCQGEGDNYTLGKQNVSATTYKNNLQTVINRTRAETGKNISWVIALTSASPYCTACPVGTYANPDDKIIEGQRATIRETSNVYTGPSTDGIQNPGRDGGVHFTGNGLIQLAEAWNNSLTDDFFNSSQTSIPSKIPDLAFTCKDNQVDVALPSGGNNYEWSNNAISFNSGKFSNQQIATLNVDNGRQYFARYRDGNGNVVQVPAISFKGSNVPVSTITATGATDFCEGNKAVLKANDAAIYEWNNGNKTQELTVTTSGTYSVKSISQFGCQSDFSSPLTIVSKPVPPKPVISVNGSTVFCADTNVVLTSSNQDATTYLWSNGTTSRTLKVNVSGSFTVKAVSDKGCTSPESDQTKITVNPLPATPSIVPNGPTTFCADTSVILTSSNQDALSYRWSTGSITRNITVRNLGDYTVKTVDKNGCVSKSSIATKIKVNALPPAPSISSTRDTVLCQGESTILQMSLVNGGFPTWLATQDGTTSKYNIQSLNVNKSGSFQGLQTDLNGCKSVLSSSVYVAIKVVPTKIESIVRLSPYSIGFETNNTAATSYVWQFNGTDRTDFTGKVVRINEAGRYRVTAKNIYKTLSYGDKVCIADPSSEFSFELYNDNGMSIYPNPSKGVFSIDSKVDWRNSSVEIYNLSGAFIKSGVVSIFDEVKKIDLTDLPEGEYMLRIKTDNFYTITKRIIINR
ncbi:MAG: T9SS type A sorting domain-containing protein [Bacteroidota bacterium]